MLKLLKNAMAGFFAWSPFTLCRALAVHDGVCICVLRKRSGALAQEPYH